MAVALAIKATTANAMLVETGSGPAFGKSEACPMWWAPIVKSVLAMPTLAILTVTVMIVLLMARRAKGDEKTYKIEHES